MIKEENGKFLYYDRNGKQITDGCLVRWSGYYSNGKTERVYLTADGQLGTDATNPSWIKSGIAYACEYGIYPFTKEDTENLEVVEEA